MMEPTATIPPATFLIILALAILIALVAGYAARMFEERPKPEAQPEKVTETEAQVLPEEHTALKVTLDKSLQWHVEVDGTRVKPNELTAEQRARLVNVLVQIRPWVDGKTVAPAPVAAPAPSAAPQAAAPVTVLAAEPPAKKDEEKGKLKLSIGRGFRSLMANDLKIIENAKPPSIVAQIDELLQKRLAPSPLANREIRLEEGALGEVVVYVGKTRYAGVDDVPDPEIQTIIKAAIKDWEKTT